MAKISFSEALVAKEAISSVIKKGPLSETMVEDAGIRTALQSGGVVGVGVGLLAPEDEGKGAAVVLYVTKTIGKGHLDALAKGISVKVGNKGVPVSIRIEKTGAFHANAGGTLAHGHPTEEKFFLSLKDGEYKRRVRPVPAGYSVGTPNESGTVGLIVIDTPGLSQLYVMSNNHVLNKDNSTGYTETVQPGGADGGVSGTDTIGRLDQFVQLIKGQDNYLDAATAIPTSNSLLDPRYGRNRIVLPGHYNQVAAGWKVFKAGRTTEDVTGTIDSVNTDTDVDYGSLGGLGVIHYKNQVIVKGVDEPVSLPGVR